MIPFALHLSGQRDGTAARRGGAGSSDLTLVCRISRTLGWLLTGKEQMVCTILHRKGWSRLAAITDLVCYQREAMSYHCARMAEIDARLERLTRRRRAAAARPPRCGSSVPAGGSGQPRILQSDELWPVEEDPAVVRQRRGSWQSSDGGLAGKAPGSPADGSRA